MKHLFYIFLSLLLAGCNRMPQGERPLSNKERQTRLVNEISTTPMLYTVSASAQVIVTDSDGPHSWKRIFGNRTIMVPVKANIKAGVDLSKVQQISFHGNVVTITLPPPEIEIESCIVSNESIAQEVSLLRSDFSEQEKALLAAQGRKKIQQMLSQMDIVIPAQERARQTLRGMAEALGYYLIVIYNTLQYSNIR